MSTTHQDVSVHRVLHALHDGVTPQGGEGLGAMCGEKTLASISREQSYFRSIETHRLARDIQNNWYVVTKERHGAAAGSEAASVPDGCRAQQGKSCTAQPGWARLLRDSRQGFAAGYTRF